MLEAVSISRTFGSTRANDCLTMSIERGEIVGLLGENGAGKSTLLSTFAGMIQPDSGHLQIDGEPVVIRSPKDALRLGISIVFQHFSLVPAFTVREQMRLAGWKADHLPDILASRFRGDEVIDDLSLGERQLVEISRALVSRPRFLLLDEPTSILTTAESERLFDIMRGLRSDGTAVVLVTHKMHEAMAVCDRIVVLRHGKSVDHLIRTDSGWPEGTERRLLASMFGTDLIHSPDVPRQPSPAGSRAQTEADSTDGTPAVFRATGLASEGSERRRELRQVNLEIGRGEICAIVGVDGQGQRELAAVCAGYSEASGSIHLSGNLLPMGDASAFRKRGIAYLTDDRMGEGTVPGFTVEDVLAMKRQRDWPFSRAGLLRRRAIREFAGNMISRWRIEPPRASAPIGTLSGGNIQKVLLARELDIATAFLIVNKPSQGLDSRTRDLVWDAIHEFARDGGGVLLLTSDIDEALEQADRVGVMYAGAVSGFQPVGRIERSTLERMMVVGWQ